MDKFVLVVGLLCYLTTAVVIARGHFSSPTTPREVRFGIIASYAGLAALIYLMLPDQHAIGARVAALAIFVASLSFEASPLAEEYMNYRKTAGMLWPKFHAAEQRP